jgi:hypothetical protein
VTERPSDESEASGRLPYSDRKRNDAMHRERRPQQTSTEGRSSDVGGPDLDRVAAVLVRIALRLSRGTAGR